MTWCLTDLGEVESRFEESLKISKDPGEDLRLNRLGAMSMSSSKGPRTIENFFSGSATTLTTMDSDNSLHLVNADIVKKYYA